MQAHYKIKNQNMFRNASIPHSFYFDFALYLENRIWKIQNIKWFNQKIVTMPIETSEEVIFNR